MGIKRHLIADAFSTQDSDIQGNKVSYNVRELLWSMLIISHGHLYSHH